MTGRTLNLLTDRIVDLLTGSIPVVIRVAPDTDLAGYPVIRQMKPDIRPDSGYKKRPDIRYNHSCDICLPPPGKIQRLERLSGEASDRRAHTPHQLLQGWNFCCEWSSSSFLCLCLINTLYAIHSINLICSFQIL